MQKPLCFLIFACLLLSTTPAFAQQPLLDEAQWTALRDESSGNAPYENLRFLTTLHRVPATPAFDQAAQYVADRARDYGLKVDSESFPADGQTHYGLMRAYLGWQVHHARLWQLQPEHTLLADWQTDPIRLADYSHSADVEAALVDVGDGTHEADYAGKDVADKIVLADGVLSEVQAIAVTKLGAAGIVSDMPNQSTAWAGLDPTLVRWGHLDARAPKGFAFMVSHAGAESLRAGLRDHAVILKAQVEAEVGAGHWSVVAATIPGSDPTAGEIVYSCHLDHQRPGANDNGSGCVTILESARMLARLIESGRLPRPARGLRFLFGPEVEGTMAYLSAHPALRRHLKADIHMDMVGGDPFKNKSMLHVTATPWSLPSFVTDVGSMMAERIRSGAAAYADTGQHAEAAVIEERGGAPGTRNVFLVNDGPYTEGSDHDDYDSATIGVPSLYLCDWPDIYIHTDHDSLSMIDATKLRRVALLGAASGYALAALKSDDVPAVASIVAVRGEARLSASFQQARQLLPDSYEAHNLLHQALTRETGTLRNLAAFTGAPPASIAAATQALKTQVSTFESWLPPASAPVWQKTAAAQRVPRRIGEFGPLHYQNDDVLRAKLGPERVARIELLREDGNRLIHEQERGELYGYEILNFVDGHRSVGEIRDAVSGELGPVSLELVADYLAACQEAGIVAQ
jgi:aminopeptidase YwaD